jgi:hypothetical protein
MKRASITSTPLPDAPPERNMPKKSLFVLVFLATLITCLNALKPLVVDDDVYYQYAAHIAAHPGDPYGFILNGDQEPNKVLAPPVLLY